jgi:PAS domain S-box-containing protein
MPALTREILSCLPAAVAYLSGPDLVVEFANEAYRRLVGGRDVVGLPPRKALPDLSGGASLEILRQAWRTGQPRSARENEVKILRDGGPPEQLFADLEFRPVRDADGAVAGVVLYAADVTTHVRDRRRLEAALQENASLLDRLRDANVLGVVVNTEQGTYEANDAFLALIGRTREDLAAGRISYPAITAPEWVGRDREAFDQLLARGAFQPYEKEYVHRDGHRVPVLVGGAAVGSDPLRWVTFVVDLTARQRAERERAELVAREQAARSEADGARERLTFLLRAGAFAAAARDRHELLEHAAQLVVPGLADHCIVYVPAEDGTLRAASLAHRDPRRAPVLAEFRDVRVPTAGPMATQLAFTSGTSQVLAQAAAALPNWRELAPDVGNILARLQADSVLATPLKAGHRTLGVLNLARDADRPCFAETDVKVAEEFARLLADAMAHAETSAREHTIAETLQRAVLPAAAPAIAGLDLAVSYLPASDGVHVGGDWYDVFPLGAGRAGLVIGDVVGHSIASASIMGQVRSMLRAYAIDHRDPGEVLERTNTALARLLPEAIASAVYAVLDLTTGDLSYANAGHPPPLLTAGTGKAEFLDDASGVMLGASPEISLPAGRRRLTPGTGLLLYTDGLIEDRRRDIDEGLSAIATAVRRSGARTADQIRAAAESLLHGEPSRADDVCLLAARLPGLPRRPGPPAPTRPLRQLPLAIRTMAAVVALTVRLIPSRAPAGRVSHSPFHRASPVMAAPPSVALAGVASPGTPLVRVMTCALGSPGPGGRMVTAASAARAPWVLLMIVT